MCRPLYKHHLRSHHAHKKRATIITDGKQALKRRHFPQHHTAGEQGTRSEVFWLHVETFLRYTAPPEQPCEFPTNLAFLILIGVQAYMTFFFFSYCLRAKTLPTSSKCFFSYSPQFELGIFQPCHHKSVEPLCSCWPLRSNRERYFFFFSELHV